MGCGGSKAASTSEGGGEGGGEGGEAGKLSKNSLSFLSCQVLDVWSRCVEDFPSFVRFTW